jgi:hypothetical protein
MKSTYRDRAPHSTVPSSIPSDELSPSHITVVEIVYRNRAQRNLPLSSLINPSILIIDDSKVLSELLLQESLDLIVHCVLDAISAETVNLQSFQGLNA